MDECTQESCRMSVCDCPDRSCMLGINISSAAHFKIGDVVTDKNGAQVVVCPETLACDGCFYYGTGCDSIRSQDGEIGCTVDGLIFKLQEKKC